MYCIGIKQKGFNPDNILSENSAHWLTYFNPDSKLKFQTANHWNSAGVKEFTDAQQAIDLMHEVQNYGIKGCFVALIEKDRTTIITDTMGYFIMMVGWSKADDMKYVLTEQDVENGGWKDIDAENFVIETREEAEAIKAHLENYCLEKGYNVRFTIVYQDAEV